MGNNAAFTRFEAAVIAVYNRGVLDKELLSDLMRPYEGVDIDHGGMEGTLANDGFDIEEIVIRTFGKTLPARPDLPPNHREWTAEQEALHGACQEVRVIAGGMGCSHEECGHPAEDGTRKPSSQTGGRGFEPRLPLHLFNHLQPVNRCQL